MKVYELITIECWFGSYVSRKEYYLVKAGESFLLSFGRQQPGHKTEEELKLNAVCIGNYDPKKNYKPTLNKFTPKKLRWRLRL